MRLVTYGLALACLLGTAPFARAEDPGVDVRVLIDVSGSMKQTDPDFLRRSALSLFVDLLPEGTRAGVWMFAKGVARLVPHGAVDARWRRRAAAAVGRVHSRGLFTDIEAALASATSDWREGAGASARHLILLTDGVVDISKQPEESAQSRARILDEVLPRLVEAGVKIHAIGLENDTDEALLRRLTRETDGLLLPAAEADRLERHFLALLEESAPQDTVPLRDGGFTIDASIDEMTILVFRGADDAPTRLQDPDGLERDESQPGPATTWRRQGRYELITVQKPAPGDWRVDPSRDPDNRVMVVTDLSLEVSDVAAYLAPTSRAPLTATLTAAGAPLEAEGIGGFVEWRAMLEAEGGPTVTLGGAATGPATFEARLGGGASEGPATIVVTADSGTFTRQVRRRVEFRRPVAVERIADDAGTVAALQVAPRPESVIQDGLRIDASLESPAGERIALATAVDESGIWTVTLVEPGAPGPHRVRLEVTGTSPAGKPFSASLTPLVVEGPAPVPEPAPEPEPRPEAPAEPAPAGPDLADGRIQLDPDAPTSWPLVGGVLLGMTIAFLVVAFLVRRRMRDPSGAVLDALIEEPVPA